MTITLKDPNRSPNAVHAGISSETIDQSLTDSLSDSLINLIKVPHGATLLEYNVYMAGLGGHGLVLEDDQGNIFSESLSNSGSVVQRATKNLPHRYSFSDDATTRFAWLRIQVSSASAAVAAGTRIRAHAMWRMGGEEDS